jgi:FkbM family methyltransferase
MQVVGKKKTVSTYFIAGKKMMMPSSFLMQYRSIFLNDEYALPESSFSKKSPLRILDLGANYGMSVVYFKEMYPDAEIVAFEADPDIYKTLKKNMELRNYKNINLYNKAAWVNNDELIFEQNGLGGGALNKKTKKTSVDIIKVSCVDMSEYLDNKTFDVVKIDIEGAERELIPHVIDAFKNSSWVIFEYHSQKGRIPNLGVILSYFEERGFKYYIRAEDDLINPFTKDLIGSFDNRLVIYCKKNTDE